MSGLSVFSDQFSDGSQKADNREPTTETSMLINLLAILGPGALLVLFDELLRRGR